MSSQTTRSCSISSPLGERWWCSTTPATGDFNTGKFTPYPTELSRARVSVEEAPVDILAPDDSVFHYPNTITAKDFDGWVQERGLYFMDKWDDHFTPLLSCHDPGRGRTEGRAAACPVWQGHLHLCGLRILPATAGGRARRRAALCESVECERQQVAVET